jgi:hypothetical protein
LEKFLVVSFKFSVRKQGFEAVFLPFPAGALRVGGSKRGLEGDLKGSEARQMMSWRAFLILLRT